MNDQFIKVRGASLRYWYRGGAGPVVLLSHCIGQSLEFWHRQFESLASPVRLVAWDMPGHGLSEEVDGADDLEGMAGVAWQLLDALGVRRAHLVGNSLGCAVSLRMADQAQERVQSLLLANSAMLGPQVTGVFKAMTLPWLGELMCRPSPKAIEQQTRAIVHKVESITPLVRSAIERNTYRPGSARRFLALLRKLTTVKGQREAHWQRSLDILSKATVPVLFVHGEQDKVLPPEHSKNARALVRTSQLEVFSDCGHTPQLEHPMVFNALLEELVR